MQHTKCHSLLIKYDCCSISTTEETDGIGGVHSLQCREKVSSIHASDVLLQSH